MFIASILLATASCAADLSAALHDERAGEDFDIVATVSSDWEAGVRDIAVEDASGAVIISPPKGIPSPPFKSGMNIHAVGKLNRTQFDHVFADCLHIDVVGTNAPPAVRRASFHEILSGQHDCRIVSTSGTLRDYFRDEIDPRFVYLILCSDSKTLYAAYHLKSDTELQSLDALGGGEVDLLGLCNPRPAGSRRNIGRILLLRSLPVLDKRHSMPFQPFAAPLIAPFRHLQPYDIPTLGRHRALGHVLAVWQGQSLLIRTSTGSLSRVDLAKSPAPRCGDTVEVVGFPETDLYRINFARAIWRKAVQQNIDTDAVTNITADILMSDTKGNAAINPDFHGRSIRLRGMVRSLPSIGNDGRFYLESDGYTLPIDISANPSLSANLEIGSVIDVTGVCVMDIENWRPNLVFPHIKEVMIVTRTPTDIIVVKRPPWWTPARLMIVIGSLLLALLVILLWNRALKALAEKRGKALANEELERLESDLKVCERTRLAVELHDSIAQNLTGVSMEIDTAMRSEKPLPTDAAQHMNRALRTIDSCRGELRNCLWDLRSQALEEEDMNKAIHLTLSQTIGKADLNVRFNVPRSRFTDNTAHTILRIIRELVTNAIRHGKATEIKVAGSIEDDTLKFSVRDNGCGFDPDTCPGVLDGHFGLQGIRERIASLEGDVQIESAPGKATRVTVTINALQNADNEKI